MNAETVFPDAECFRHHEGMSDWERLGQHVIARRTELGFRNRADFATAAQVSSRLISDIEKGRRSNFDRVTLSALEQALGWETGSVQAIVDGGEPRVRLDGSGRISGMHRAAGADTEEADEIELIYASDLSARKKLELIRKMLLLRKQAKLEEQQDSSTDPQVKQAP